MLKKLEKTPQKSRFSLTKRKKSWIKRYGSCGFKSNWKQCKKHVVMILELFFYEGSSYYCKCSDERRKEEKKTVLIKLREPDIMAL
jgi:hypothetical protein